MCQSKLSPTLLLQYFFTLVFLRNAATIKQMENSENSKSETNENIENNPPAEENAVPTRESLLKESRKFNIDLAPKVSVIVNPQ